MSPHISEIDLNTYFDGELPEPKAGEIRAHLESCEFCQERYEELRALSQALFSTAPWSEDNAFVEGVMDRVRQESAPATRLWQFPALRIPDWTLDLGWAAAPVLALGLFLFVVNGNGAELPATGLNLFSQNSGQNTAVDALLEDNWDAGDVLEYTLGEWS
ncbi:MAG: zf-HC2 domain-containing protein [Candidatus Omnitrophica bacterium]|nr:zf-HC2 domain-containing protein [Candidatus Omnitrophota bacterium]